MKREDTFRDFVLEQLSALGDVRCRAMFGGYGLYHGDRMFGILFQDRLYFKTDDATRSTYEQRGMEPLRPNERQVMKAYYEVPADILESRESLAKWAAGAAGLSP
jgi:DNA transformation protein and related proteins